MADYAEDEERAKDIVRGVLGLEPTPGQLEKAADAMWRMDPMGYKSSKYSVQPPPDEPTTEELAEVLVENTRRLFQQTIDRAADRYALEKNEAALDTARGDYTGDFQEAT